MRKFFLGAALVAASFGMAQSADAATVMDVDGVSTVLAISDYEGTSCKNHDFTYPLRNTRRQG